MIIASISTPMLWKCLNITISIIFNLKNLVTYCFPLQEKELSHLQLAGKKKNKGLFLQPYLFLTLKQPENSYMDGDDKIQSRIT